jgi:hypothetical protein
MSTEPTKEVTNDSKQEQPKEKPRSQVVRQHGRGEHNKGESSADTVREDPKPQKCKVEICAYF